MGRVIKGRRFTDRGVIFLVLTFGFFLTSCSVSNQVSRSAKKDLLETTAFRTAHVGISIFDPAANKYLYNYQGDKYFVPASNIKIPSCYAAMKYLGDSIVAAVWLERDTAILVLPGADPTLLHPDFPNQPFLDKLRKEKKNIYVSEAYWHSNALGSGWAWSDYDQAYMAERSLLPVYGNVLQWTQELTDSSKPPVIYSDPEINWEVNFTETNPSNTFSVNRDIGMNRYTINQGKERKKSVLVPFVTNGLSASLEILSDVLAKPVRPAALNKMAPGEENPFLKKQFFTYSQPVDSMLKPMMHRSDNFFAEQSLLMVSMRKLGVLDDSKLRDTLLKSDFNDLPQKPRWADGSGLSRYNLFTPQDFVAILNKMKNEFGMERIKVILPTGGEGTISSYYKADSGYIFAKTGTLSGVVAFSGFLYTKKGKLLIFSTLVNNHLASATEIRRTIEKFIQRVRQLL